MTEPKTEAGRALLSDVLGNDTDDIRDAILAIEAEAAKPWREAAELFLSGIDEQPLRALLDEAGK